MHPNWTPAFSIFSASKISQIAGGSDAWNIRLPEFSSFKDLWRTLPYNCNTRSSLGIFDIQDTKKTEVLPSTSASIVKAGLNKVWRWPRSTEPILGLRTHPSKPRSGIPLQKAPNEKQPEQGIVHTPNLDASIPTRLPSHLTSRPPTSIDPQPASGSINLSFSLQKVAKDEQPRQDTLHHLTPVETSGHIPRPTVAPILTRLPSPQTSQLEQEPFTPTNPRHPSGSRFLSFSLQNTANEKEPEASRAFESSVPQPATVPLPTHLLSAKASQTEFAPILTPKQNAISFPHASSSNATPKQRPLKTKSLQPPSGSRFLQSPLQISGSSAANYSESPQQSVGLSPFAAGQDPFYLPSISSPYHTQQFPSNPLPDIFPPKQSLLFLTPNPPPKRKINFKPFSPEEETVPLPPAPEPTNNQLGYPVQGPDDRFLMNRLPSPLLPTNQVPYLSLSPIQSSAILSPLSIALLLSPRPAVHPPNELNIKIAGSEGYLNAENYEPHITHFLLSRTNKTANSLVIAWQQSHVDNGGARGMMSLKALFDKLNETVLGSDRVALSSFSKLSITIPDLAKDVIPCDDLLRSFKDDDSIDLTNALDLLEFAWRGDFAVLGLNFNHLPMTNLTVLNVNSTHISLNDALQLLHSCPNAGAVNLGTIQDVNVCDFGDLRKPSDIPYMIFGNLWSLTLESNVALHSFFERVGWSSLVSVVLTLRQDAAVDVYTLPLAWDNCRDIMLHSHLTTHALTHLKNEYPRLQYNDIGSQ